MRTLLAVDLSNQIYKAVSVNANLTSGGTFTGGVYGFLYFLARAVAATKATDVVICKDCPPYARSKEYPQYKKLRQDKRDEVVAEHVKTSKILLDEVFEILGMPVMEEQGFESDDLIALIVHKYRHRFDRILAASNDSDLYQLFEVCEGFAIYKGKKGTYDRRDFERDWGLTRSQFMLAHSLMGTHNDIQGIDGIGPVRAKAIVKDPRKMREYQGSHGAMIERNHRLIKLPHHELDPTIQLPRPTKPFQERELIRYLGRLDIKTNPQLINSFERILR